MQTPQRGSTDIIPTEIAGTLDGLFRERVRRSPRMIAYRWGGGDADAVDRDHSTVFRFTLEPLDGGTQLTVVESGFDTLADPAAGMESNRAVWDSELDEIVAYLGKGN